MPEKENLRPEALKGNLDFYSQTTFVYAIRFDLTSIMTQWLVWFDASMFSRRPAM